jgi:hypothetical protein
MHINLNEDNFSVTFILVVLQTEKEGQQQIPDYLI